MAVRIAQLDAGFARFFALALRHLSIPFGMVVGVDPDVQGKGVAFTVTGEHTIANGPKMWFMWRASHA